MYLYECIRMYLYMDLGFPYGSVRKESACIDRRHGFNLWVRKIPWRRTRESIPEFLSGESHRQRSLEGCSSWCHKESYTTEQLHEHTYTYTHTHTHIYIFILYIYIYKLKCSVPTFQTAFPKIAATLIWFLCI